MSGQQSRGPSVQTLLFVHFLINLIDNKRVHQQKLIQAIAYKPINHCQSTNLLFNPHSSSSQLPSKFIFSFNFVNLINSSHYHYQIYQLCQCPSYPIFNINYVLMKKFFVLFCERNLHRPHIYKSFQSIRKKKTSNPNLQYTEFANQIDAEKFIYPKKISFLMVQENLNALSGQPNQQHLEVPEEIQEEIKREQYNIEDEIELMAKQTAMEENTKQKIKALYQQIFAYQGQSNFVKSKANRVIRGGNQYYGVFDGCSKGNPGKAGIGYALLNRKSDIIFQNCLNIGFKTNNQAEFLSLIFLLLDCKQNRVTNLKVFGDSELVINGVKDKYKIGDQKLRYMNYLGKHLARNFDKIEFQHIKRQKNTLADKLSNDGIKKKYLGKIQEEK